MLLFRLSRYIKHTNTINQLKQFYQLICYAKIIYIYYRKNDKIHKHIVMVSGKLLSYKITFSNGDDNYLYIPRIIHDRILELLIRNKICTTKIILLNNGNYSIEKVIRDSAIRENKLAQISLIRNLKY